MTHHPPGAGKSSYDLIDLPRFRGAISLRPGMTVVDLGCGAGRYLAELANRVGPEGRIVAVDQWAEGIELVKQSTPSLPCPVEAHQANLGTTLPVENQTADLCLMATVLHDLVQDGTAQAALKETARILKPDGILAVIEFKKQEGPPGPPRKIRLRLEEVSMLLMPASLIRFSPVTDLGPDLWFAEFKRLARAGSRQ